LVRHSQEATPETPVSTWTSTSLRRLYHLRLAIMIASYQIVT
jgi:hypothetical protein